MIFDCTPYGLERTIDIEDGFIFKSHVFLDATNGGGDERILILSFIHPDYKGDEWALLMKDGCDDIQITHGYTPKWKGPKRGNRHKN